MAVFPNNSADNPGALVSEEAPMLEYSLDEKHPPRDLTPEEKAFRVICIPILLLCMSVPE